MKAFVVIAIIIGSGFAAPLESVEEIEELQRTKKSYGAPCAGAAQSYGSYAPVALYLGPSHPSGAYREDEHLEEDHKARSYYDASIGGLSASSDAYGSSISTSIGLGGAGGSGYGGASAGGYSGSSGIGLAAPAGGYSGAGLHTSVGLAPAASAYSGVHASGIGLGGLSGAGAVGPAVGIFPAAHVGGCNVPLLLSCAPNVVAGHLAPVAHHAAYSAPAYAAPAYRSFEEDMKKEAEWAKARKADHHKVSDDHSDAEHHVNHHVVSHDYPEPNVTHQIPESKEDAHAAKNFKS